MRRRRVSSPSAAKIGAEFHSVEFFSGAFFEGVLRRSDMFFDVVHLFVPALAVHAKRIQTTRRRDIVEAGFDDAQQGAALDFFQLEYNQRGRFFRVVDGGVN